MTISLIAVIVLAISVLRILQCEGRGARSFLAAPFLATALLELFDLCALGGLAPQIPWRNCSLLVEGMLPPLWLALSLTHGREPNLRDLPRRSKLLIAISALMLLVPLLLPPQDLYYAPDFPSEQILFLTDLGYYYYVALLLFLTGALTNFEATLVHADPDALWRVKLGVVALGSMLAVLIFYYSHALLYRTLSMELIPVRSLLFVAAALMMSYSRTHWRGAARVKVSQAVLFRSVVLAVVAGYLLLLGALGEGMKYFGPQFPRVLILSLGFLSGITLLLVLLSERLKREIKVFLHKNFSQSKYDYRAQWLGLTERLASFESGEEILRLVVSAYCDIFGVKGGALYQHQEGCGWFCAAAVLGMEELKEKIEEENPLIHYLAQRRWVFSSRDHNPEVEAANRELFERHRISFVVPLFEKERLTGFVLLGEQIVAGEQYRYEDFDLMKTIARQASVVIQHQRLSEQLTQSKAVEAVGNLATFVLHDLKNLAATVSLIVENAQQHIGNPEFQEDLLESLGSTSKKMQGLIGRLRNLGESELFQVRPVNLLELVQRTARLVQGGNIKVAGTPETALVDEEELHKVLVNLFMNAIEASSLGGQITAEVGCAGMPFIRVSDKGCGMSPRFIRSELFAPFRSTKRSGLGIGMYQCRQIVAAHGGRMDVASVEGSGTVFTVWLPGPAEGAAEITEAA